MIEKDSQLKKILVMLQVETFLHYETNGRDANVDGSNIKGRGEEGQRYGIVDVGEHFTYASPLMGPVDKRLPWSVVTPCEGYWERVASAVQVSLGVALARMPVVALVDSAWLRGHDMMLVHPSQASHGQCGAATLEERMVIADVVLVHDDKDVLLLSCTQEVDERLRRHLSAVGWPRALEAVERARALHEGGSLKDFICERMRHENDPVRQGTTSRKSPGVTVDFGLHDGQLMNAMHLCTDIMKGRVHRTRNIRSKTYEQHRQACMEGALKRSTKFLKTKLLMSSKEVSRGEAKTLMVPMAR